MREERFDAFVRQAAAEVTRRTSLQALGGATLAAGLAGPVTTEAAKENKAKKKAKKKCNKTKAQCRNIVLSLDASQLPALACCNSCFTNQFLVCLVGLTA